VSPAGGCGHERRLHVALTPLARNSNLDGTLRRKAPSPCGALSTLDATFYRVSKKPEQFMLETPGATSIGERALR